MPQPALSAFFAHSARAIAHPAEDDLQLLGRFVATREEAAFAELVHRHGPLVLAVCRRMIGDHHLAEDAFQATFLVLARRAKDVKSQEGVRPFLYGVAVRVAREARSVSARRYARESPVSAIPDRAAEPLEPPDADVLRVLDEEVAGLPEHLRVAVVLCELDGLSRKEAAARLGIAEGTLSSRLAKARKLLAERLKKRGVAFPVAGLGVLSGSAPVSAQLASATVALVSPGAAVPVAVVNLSVGVIRMMFAHELRIVLSLAAVSVGAAACAALGTHLGFADPAAAIPTFAAAPVPKNPLDALQEKMNPVRKKAIAFIKGKQSVQGDWEGSAVEFLAGMEGGKTALAALALLQAGVPASDPGIGKAADYLAKLPPKKTYVVSLQTQVLARVDAKKHAAAIQKNVEWLLENAIGWKNGGELQGWSYSGTPMGDASNTHVAVIALHAAAGAKVDNGIWPAIRKHYVQTRKANGWGYQDQGDASRSMTCAALVGLAVAKKHVKDTEASQDAFDRGMKALLTETYREPVSRGYQNLVDAELGQLLGSTEFKSGDKVLKWYRNGAEQLVKDQQADGSLKSERPLGGDELINTAFGLYFLGPPPK